MTETRTSSARTKDLRMAVPFSVLSVAKSNAGAGRSAIKPFGGSRVLCGVRTLLGVALDSCCRLT